jgi:hypothetical protein
LRKPPDSLHLQAAQGWLELGNPAEADAGPDEIRADPRAHLDVLEARLEIFAAAKQRRAVLDISRSQGRGRAWRSPEVEQIGAKNLAAMARAGCDLGQQIAIPGPESRTVWDGLEPFRTGPP